jgi:hypothetical protein
MTYDEPHFEDRMTESAQDRLIRQYAAGEITWHMLRERAFDNRFDVLGAFGRLGLRPPVAPMDRPNVEACRHGRALSRQALAEANRDEPARPHRDRRLAAHYLGCRLTDPTSSSPEHGHTEGATGTV